MKIHTIVLLLIACLINSLAAGPLQIKIESQLEGVDAKWFTGLNLVPDEEGIVKLPTILSRMSEEVKIEVLKSYTSHSAVNPARKTSCGLTMQINPTLWDKGIAMRGSIMLKQALDPKSGNVASKFNTVDTLIGHVWKNGESKKIDLASGGSIVITVSLIDVTGNPTKLNIEQDTAVNTQR